MNEEIDDSTCYRLLKESQIDFKRQFERCKNAQVQFLSSIPTTDVQNELSWTNAIHDIYSNTSTKLASRLTN